MQKVETKIFICVFVDAENLVRLHQMTGDVQCQTFLFVIIQVQSIQAWCCYFMELYIGQNLLYTATKDKVDWF